MEQIQLLNYWELRQDKWSVTVVHHSSFISKIFEHLCNDNGINHSLNTVRHPQSNGQVKRVNGTLFAILQANMSNDDDRIWDNNFLNVESQLNTPLSKLQDRHSNSFMNIILYFTVKLYTVNHWRNICMCIVTKRQDTDNEWIWTAETTVWRQTYTVNQIQN